MHVALGLLALVVVASACAAGSKRVGLSGPLVLTAVGVAGSYLPFVPAATLTPELVLVGLLPPLLYTAAIRTSLVDLRANRRPIALLSVGLVLFTAFGVGLVAWWLLPVRFSIALALAAVIAPPDAVAATAIARRVGMPRRIVTILEGESLLNDATALVLLRTALAAASGAFSPWRAVGDFVLASVGGVAVGVVLGFALGQVRRRITDPVLDTTLSFVTPFLAYLPAEELHASGVLAVVVAGLILGHRAPVWQTAASRVAEQINWSTVEFTLENSVFLLIGLQVRRIVDDAWHSGLGHGQILLACAGVLAATVILRPVWVFPATYLPRLAPNVRATEGLPHWSAPAVISWAGMRGVVTLAAVFALPLDTRHRPVLVLAALVVVAGTLVLQGMSLPWLVRRLGLRGPTRAEDALAVAGLVQRAVDDGQRELADVDAAIPAVIVDDVRRRSGQRTEAMWERLGPSEQDVTTPSEHYRRLRLRVLHAERQEVLRVRDTGALDHEVLRAVMRMIDVEESLIDRLEESERDEEETVPLRPTKTADCAHLRAAPSTARPDTPGRCQRCQDEGLVWVHLRMCLSCGQVGCCDSSVGRHSERHHTETGHPVMRSIEPGEAWRWCYLDSQLG